MSVSVSLTWGDFGVTIESDREPYADLLDEMCTRARELFVVAMAELLETETDPEGDDDDTTCGT